MASAAGARVIAIEEHYWDAEVAGHFSGRDATRSNDLRERLHDVDTLRLPVIRAGLRCPRSVRTTRGFTGSEFRFQISRAFSSAMPRAADSSLAGLGLTGAEPADRIMRL